MATATFTVDGDLTPLEWNTPAPHWSRINNGVSTPHPLAISAIIADVQDNFSLLDMSDISDASDLELAFQCRFDYRYTLALLGASFVQIEFRLFSGTTQVGIITTGVLPESGIFVNRSTTLAGLHIPRSIFDGITFRITAQGSGWGFLDAILAVSEIDLVFSFTEQKAIASDTLTEKLIATYSDTEKLIATHAQVGKSIASYTQAEKTIVTYSDTEKTIGF